MWVNPSGVLDNIAVTPHDGTEGGEVKKYTGQPLVKSIADGITGPIYGTRGTKWFKDVSAPT